jgi:tryptophanyl-tRNA synthetase
MSAPVVRYLTGITTTGTPHLGNYVGAIRPAVQASRRAGTENFYFLADYHALIKCDEPARIARSRLEIAATWLACGLDTDRVTFYRQSDLPETAELAWLLTCVTPKGLMNRAHAYKAATDASAAAGDDAGVSMGLYSYPILMAADILLFNAHRVPVGRDQVQHIEMTRDIAQRFNHLYGGGRDLFVLPRAEVEEAVATLPGLDGRKMSKSYDNTIPLFEGGAKALRQAVARIVTDSKLPGEPKQVEGSALVAIHDAFTYSDEARESFRADLRAGLGWGDAKARLVELIEANVGPLRERYAGLMAHPDRIEDALQDGAAKARREAAALLARLREAVGLGTAARFALPASGAPSPASEGIGAAGGTAASTSGHSSGPASGPRAPLVFKQYREADGRFYFKLVAADGAVLLQSGAFEQGRDAGAWVKRLKSEGAAALADAPAGWTLAADRAALDAALASLAAAGS